MFFFLYRLTKFRAIDSYRDIITDKKELILSAYGTLTDTASRSVDNCLHSYLCCKIIHEVTN